jgi:hypothetical protein
MSTPLLDMDLDRFGRDLLTAAAPAARPARKRRLAVAVAIALLLLVPGAIAAVDRLFLAADHPMIEPPPGYTVPKVVDPGVVVASGNVSTGPWTAYAVGCGERVSVVIVTRTGRNSAACGAVRPGAPTKAAVFAPSTMYDGIAQTTWIYAAVPATVNRVTLDLSGRARDGQIVLPGAGPSHHVLAPISAPEAAKALGRDVKFVVLAVPGDQRVEAATLSGG